VVCTTRLERYPHSHYPLVLSSLLTNLLTLIEWFESCGITNVEEMGWWDKAKYVRKEDGKSIEIACTPCQHWANRTLTDKCKTLWASWAVIGKKQRVFFAGAFISFLFVFLVFTAYT